ncbi:alpha/beta hydrolase family protein [Schlesneria paludicola]|uniref:alpha/beta hydrolase family protein n=1 Tax=Schlesneria paludicola TaxID=360056 RepID=UPI00029A26FE|nr:acetylxylan esterase [Schlesneria paludicola]
MTERHSMDRRDALKLAALAAASAAVVQAPKRATAEVPRVLPAGSLPADTRLGDLKDLNGDFSWHPSPSIVEWKKRAEQVKRQLMVANGLWPMPTKHPLQAIVHGKVERDDYTVERVILQTGHGLYCTGSFYRPKAPPRGKYPAVLCPHGHWENGRFYEHTDKLFETELASHAESLPSGRFPLQARCVQLARMGCLVFIYDMLGYADSAPLPFQLAHGFKQQRPELSSPEKWGLFSAQSELRCLSIVGLQTWNSIRALDWIISMDDVDSDRIGVTGASGGGTQTFLLGAIDPRPAAFFPAVMVSTAMQGGCTCENASYLRVNTGNIEIAAMLAPRPLGMTAANDWTRELETKGLPELKQHYAMFGVPDAVEGKYRSFPHNYNQPSRLMMYEFFNQHLKLGQTTPIVERDFVPLTKVEATVWNAEHPMPERSVENELKLVNGFASDQVRQFAAAAPKDLDSLKAYRDLVGGAWEVLIGRKLPEKEEFSQDNKAKSEGEDLLKFNTLVRLKKYGEEIPTLFFLPRNWNKHVAVWVTDEGKASALKPDGSPKAEIQKLLDSGVSVAIPDLFYQGEFLADGQQPTHARKVKNPREFVGYTLGYNHPLFSQRVHDVLTMIAFCRFSKYEPSGVHLIGLGRTAGPIAAAAAVQAGPAVNRLAIGTAGFRFATLTDAYDPMLLPGAVKYGDVPGLLSLAAPHPMWLSGEGSQVPPVVATTYQVANAPTVVSYDGPPAGEAAAAVNWLLSGLS